MTAKERRALIERLRAEAELRHLELVHRERTKGAWVWDAVDSRSGVVALRGVRLEQLAAYLEATFPKGAA